MADEVMALELEDEVVDEAVVDDWVDWLVVALALDDGVATK